MKKIVKIKGMTCAHCAGAVEKALTGIDGVTAVEVKLAEGEAVVDCSDTVSDTEIKSAVDEAGFKVKKNV